MTGEDSILEAGRESLDLVLDRLGHVDCGAAGNVAVRVARVLARGCSARIELTLLTKQDVNPKKPIPRWALLARLPFQFLFMAWAYWFTG